MAGLNWNVNATESALILQIADTYMDYCSRPENIKKLDILISLTVTHANGCHLDLEGMLSGRLEDLAHDVAGIMANLDHETGKLGTFTPRHALVEVDELKARFCPYCKKIMAEDMGWSEMNEDGTVCRIGCAYCTRIYFYRPLGKMELMAIGYDWLCEVCGIQNDEGPDVGLAITCKGCGARYKPIFPGE
jgi:uncharacterized Zn-finger protein